MLDGVKGVWNKGVSASEGALGYFQCVKPSTFWLTPSGAAGGDSQDRGKDKKTFPAHLGFSVPSSAAHQGPHNNITRASQLMALVGADAWRGGSFSPNGHCCLIRVFWTHLPSLKALQILFNRLPPKLWPSP